MSMSITTKPPSRPGTRPRVRGWVDAFARRMFAATSIIKPNRQTLKGPIMPEDMRKPWEIPMRYNDPPDDEGGTEPENPTPATPPPPRDPMTNIFVAGPEGDGVRYADDDDFDEDDEDEDFVEAPEGDEVSYDEDEDE